VSVVVPCWNGRRWLPGLLESLGAQTPAPAETIVVDNGSTDGSVEYLSREHPEVRVLTLAVNTGFAHAVNRGIEAASTEAVALINTDLQLSPDWIGRMAEALAADPQAAAVTGKMLGPGHPPLIYDAGDILRRDGACEQRGRFERDIGQYDTAGEVFGACAGAAVYRREAVLAMGGFDERYFAYLEDVDLALRLRLSGWRCRYEPVVAWHHGEGSSSALSGGHQRLVERNTLLLVGKFWPWRWLPLVAYRQLSWLLAARREGRLAAHLRGAREGVALAWRVRGERRSRTGSKVALEQAIPALPVRGPAAGGHPDRIAATFSPTGTDGPDQ
jgi:hypothetical protein